MMRESSLYGIIEVHMRKHGYTVLQEFPVGRWTPKRVDLIGIKDAQNELVCVEVKLKDFQRIVNQAHYRLFFSDFVYIAFPFRYAMHVWRNYHSILKNYGLGLMAVGDNVEVIVKAHRSAILNRDFKNYVMNLIRDRLTEEMG